MSRSVRTALACSLVALAWPALGDPPFTVTGATGNLYSIAQLNGATQSSNPSISSQWWANKSHSSLGAPPSAAQGNVHFSLVQGDPFAFYLGGGATAMAAPSSFAFGRSDINATYALARAGTQPTLRARISWSLSARGIADTFFQFRQILGPSSVASVISNEVSSYIEPVSVSGVASVVLPQGNYDMRIAASVQANSSFLNPDDGGYGTSLTVTTAALADVNTDGMVNGVDLGMVLAAWGPVPRFHAADLNQDLVVGGMDLAGILAQW